MTAPSWWKYIGGRDADRAWVAAYAIVLRDDLQIPAQDRRFYTAAMQRLAADNYEAPDGRPCDRKYFWLACHYWLGTMTTKKTAAAVASAQILGDDDKYIQRKANELVEPARDFLSAIVALLPADHPDVLRLHKLLMEWFGEQVRKVA